jgi:hypothetical protein
MAETACTSCGVSYPAGDLDRYLWCSNCRGALMKRGLRWGRIVGLVASAGLALYLYVRVQPSTRFLIIYLMLLVMTYSLTSRIAVAVVQGFYRSRTSLDDSGAAQEQE